MQVFSFLDGAFQVAGHPAKSEETNARVLLLSLMSILFSDEIPLRHPALQISRRMCDIFDSVEATKYET